MSVNKSGVVIYRINSQNSSIQYIEVIQLFTLTLSYHERYIDIRTWLSKFRKNIDFCIFCKENYPVYLDKVSDKILWYRYDTGSMGDSENKLPGKIVSENENKGIILTVKRHNVV